MPRRKQLPMLPWSMSVALLAVPCTSGVVEAQRTPATVSGIVHDSSGFALPAAEVRVRGTGTRARTDERGQYRLNEVPSGDLVLEIRRFGFHPLDLELAVAPGEARRVDVELMLIAQALDTVEVRAVGELSVAPMQVFDQRRAMYTGVFYTRQDIERRAPVRPSELLRTAPGVRVVGRSSGIGGNIVLMGRSRCRPAYFIDGRYAPRFELDQLTTSEIQGIEVYRGPSEIPPELNRWDAGCGVIAIWTRNTAADRRDAEKARQEREAEERRNP